MIDIDKDRVSTKLMWADLEMTGLNPTKDVILEVAVEITDFNFKTLGSYEARVKHPREDVVALFQANTWYRDVVPENRDDFLRTLDESKESAVVEDELVEFIGQHFGTEPAILAGNSIHNDRNFIKFWWPTLDLKLHYRMLDVSSFKILMQAKYGVEFEKKNTHRAFDDIQASIAELQSYLEWFNKYKTQES
jgi:oligoribonuclease